MRKWNNILSPHRGKLTLCILCICASVLLGGIPDNYSSVEDVFDRDWYDYMVATEYVSLDDILYDFDVVRFSVLPILMPDPDLYMMQSSDDGIRGFDAKKFPDTFVNGLMPETIGETTVYRVIVYEDRTTRDRIFLNAANKEIARVAAPFDYNPTEYVSQTFGTVWSTEEWNSLKGIYDPARVLVKFTLIEDGDIWKYVLTGSVAEAERQKVEHDKKDKGDSGIIIMKAYTGPPVEHLILTSVDSTNNALNLTLAYPWTAGDPTNSFTNRVEILCCTNLVDYWWFSLGTTNVRSTTNWIEWSDTSFTNTNNIVRFYRVGNADLDTDGDGLTDARELNMYHSSPSTNDTDGDTLTDSNEVVNLNTDPSNSNTSKPVVSITSPTNNYTWVWIP